MKRKIVIIAWLCAVLGGGCVQESPIVISDPATQEYTGTDEGTKLPQITGMYPDNLDTDIPVDADIVIIFSKPMNAATVTPATVSITDGVTPVTAFTAGTVSDGNAVVIDVTTPAALTYGAAYTVSVTTGVQDADGNGLNAASSWTFTTSTDTAPLEAPRVISGTRYPTGAAVSIYTPYAEVTFTRTMTWPDAVMWTTANFSIIPAVATGITQVSGTTYRLDLTTPLGYGTGYTVDLTNAIEDAAGTPLVEDGSDTWNFTTETDPVPGAVSITDLWIESVTDTSAVVSFSTNIPVAKNACYALYDTASPASTPVQESVLTDKTTVHTVTISPPLTPSTQYYIRAGVDTGGGLPVEVFSATELSVYTQTDGTINQAVSAAAGNQDGLVTVQNDDGTGYAFWVDGGANVYGKYFRDTTPPAGSWGASGTQINTAANMTKVVAVSDGFTDAVAVYRNNADALYARDVYNNAGVKGDRWIEAALGVTIQAGSSFSACLVHENPAVIATGTSDMPDDGAAANLLYDRDVDFSGLAFLDAGDVLAVDDTTLNWTNGAINNQTASPYDVFKYVLKSVAANPNLAALTDYYVLDADTTITGLADSVSTTTQIRSSVTNLLPVSTGDIIRTSDGTWGLASADGAWNVGGWWYVDVDRTLTGFLDGDGFTVYTTYSGPHASEAVSNPLWDLNPSTLFNPGTTVLTGDRVVNENTNAAAATSATVTAIDLARDTNYALRLSADIMDNGHQYAVVRLPSTSTYRASGYSTSAATNYNLTDGNAPFAAVVQGDIVYNIDANMSAMVTASAAGSLTLSADIFNAVNEKAIVYGKRGFLVAYIDINDFVLARSFNMADGSPLGAAFAVHSAGVNSNPVAVSDGAGNAIVFYERGGDIFATKVSAAGAALWGEAVILAGSTIVKALPDRATGGVGGAYVLADDGSGNVSILRVNGSTGAVTWTQTFTGYDPDMVADTDAPNPNRVIIAYRNTHASGGGTYFHIEARAYGSGGGAPAWTVTNISDNTAQYHCDAPAIALADAGTGASGFYITWFDGRYIAFIGYSLFAQRYNSAGTDQWAGPVYVTSPGTSGFGNALDIALLFWDDNIVTAPYGIIPVWLDYRGADTDIYYENIADDGSY